MFSDGVDSELRWLEGAEAWWGGALEVRYKIPLYIHMEGPGREFDYVQPEPRKQVKAGSINLDIIQKKMTFIAQGLNDIT